MAKLNQQSSGLKKRAKIMALFCSLLSPLAQSAEIHVLRGKLSDTQRAIMERVFVDYAKDNLESVSREIDVKFIKAESQSDVMETLTNRDVMGTIFIGHPAIDVRGEKDSRKIVNGHLQTANKRYLTKSAFSAAHRGMEFLSVLTCHGSGFLPDYLKFLPSHVKNYLSPSHNIDAVGNPLFEFTSYYSTPEVVDNIVKNLEKHLNSFLQNKPTLPPKRMEKLSITYKDLLSSNFSYEVLIDGRLVTTLETAYSEWGRKVNTVTKTVSVPLPNKTHHTIEIRPDDRNRPLPENLDFVIDDILLERVKIGGTSLLTSPIHIGDQKSRPDAKIGLSYRRNWKEFSQFERRDLYREEFAK